MEQVQRTRIGSPRWGGPGFRVSRWLLIAMIVLTGLIPSAQTTSASASLDEWYCPTPIWQGYVSANNEQGVEIQGMVPGYKYTLETIDGSWTAQWWGGEIYYHGTVSNYVDQNWYRMAYGSPDTLDVYHHWPASVLMNGPNYHRMYWTAQTTSIRFRVADAPGKFYDNNGYLSLALYFGSNYCNMY